MARTEENSSVTEEQEHSDQSEETDPVVQETSEPEPEQKPKSKPLEEDPEAGNIEAEIYLQNRIDELLGSGRGKQGRPPTLRLIPQRTFPEWARLDCRSIEVIDGEPIDLEEVARQNGGGRYMVRLKKGRSFVAHALATVSFAGPPITIPGEGPDPWADERGARAAPGRPYRPEPLAVPGIAAHEVGNSVAAFGEQFRATLEGLGTVIQTTQVQYNEIKDEIRRIRENPPDPAKEVKRSVDLVTGLLEVAKTLQPPAPTPAPVAADAGAFLAGFNQIVGSIPQMLEAWNAFTSATGAKPQPQATARPAPRRNPAPQPDPETPPAAGPSVPKTTDQPAKKPAEKKRRPAPRKRPDRGSKRKR